MVDLVGLDPTPGPTVVCLRLSRHLRLYPEGADNLDDRPRSPLDHSLGDLGRFPQKRVIKLDFAAPCS
jgi:hypothetical protein